MYRKLLKPIPDVLRFHLTSNPVNSEVLVLFCGLFVVEAITLEHFRVSCKFVTRMHS